MFKKLNNIRPPNQLIWRAKTKLNSWGARADYWVALATAKGPLVLHYGLMSGASATLLATTVLAASFVWKGNVNYSVANQENCINNPVFLPRLIKPTNTDSFNLSLGAERKILGYPVFSGETCVVAQRQPQLGTTQQLKLTHSWLPFMTKSVTLNSPPAPSVKLGRPADTPVSIRGPLVFHLSSPDNLFDYRLSANERNVTCAKLDSALLCNADRLELLQGRLYKFKIARIFAGEVSNLAYEDELATVEPIDFTASSVAEGQTIQNIPVDIVLTANKTIAGFSGASLYLIENGQKSLLEAAVALSDNTLAVTFAQPLKRSSEFELNVEALVAQDKGFMLKPYSLKFRTSGGPKVQSVNIAAYGVSTSRSIVLTLDAEPKAGQNLKDFVSASGGFDFRLSAQGRTIVISPNSSWPRCQRFTLTLSDGLKNQYDISGGSGWSYSSRTICRTSSTIGTSVKGRGIYAYRFGGGGNRVVFVGGTHGDEPSSVYILNSWVDWLEQNYDSIPADKTILVVPSINPDGIASGGRTNANNIDLNRNFPANNWKKDVVMPGGWMNYGGGGSAPLSEPESSAIANYVLGQSPELVLTYHAVGSMVIANESGNSRSLATTYGQQTGYWDMGNSEIGGIFTHDTTGAFEDWLHDKHGVPALLIELSSYGGNQFWNHTRAMKAMIED